VDEAVNIPVVSVPQRVAQAALAAIREHEHPAVSIGVPRVVHNSSDGGIAPFSSRGLAFDGRVKPDLAAPGVALTTSEPGANDDGTPSYGTVNGSSPAAAVVAGAAAVLAQARPDLRAVDLRSLLTGKARSIQNESVTAQGTGLVDLGQSVAGEIAADPVAFAFGHAEGDGWHAFAGASDPQRLDAHTARPCPQHRQWRPRARAEAPLGAAEAGRQRAGDAEREAERRASRRRLGGG
jgi:hypothetical protein